MTELQKYDSAQIARKTDVAELAYIKEVGDAAKIFYKAQGDHLAAQEAKEISIRSVHRAGQLLDGASKGKGGRPKTRTDTVQVSEYALMLDDAGIHRNTGSDWQRIGRVPIEELEAFFVENPHEGKEYSLGWLKRFAFMYIPESTGDEWYTPNEYIESVKSVLGEIDLDPASSEQANKTVAARRIFTKEDSGLEHDWRGRVFMNPPYSKNKPFAERLIAQYEAGNISEAIVLVGAHGIETQWFCPFWDHVLCFTGHRIKFDTPDGQKIAGNINGSVFVYFGMQERTFADEFVQHGYVVKRWP